MKISVNRLCKLAGIESSKSNRLNEGSNRSFHEEPYYQDEVEYRFGQNQLSEGESPEGMAEDDDYAHEMDGMDEMESFFEGDEEDESPLDEMDMDELIEIDERMLVQELRRAKKIMNESRIARRRQITARKDIDNIIEEEVASLMKDYNGGWVYGNNKPTFSKKGQITTSFPGIGFGKKY